MIIVTEYAVLIRLESCLSTHDESIACLGQTLWRGWESEVGEHLQLEKCSVCAIKGMCAYKVKYSNPTFCPMYLTLCILMDSSFWFDTINLE